MINNYSIFRAISIMRGGVADPDGFRDSHYRELLYKAIQSLEQFNMFAFVLNDSESNPGFDMLMRNIFGHFDGTTGDRMLFFAVVAPQYHWELKNSQRAYYRHIRRFELSQQESLLENPGTGRRDTGLITYALCEMLGVPYDALPALVVTNNLYSTRFAWYQTDESIIDRQLNIVGIIARDFPEVKYNWDIAESELRRQFTSLKALRRSGFSSQESSLSGMLSQCLSFVNLEGMGHEISKEARTQSAAVIRRIQSSIMKMRFTRQMPEDQEPAEELLKVISEFALLLSLIESDWHVDPDYNLPGIIEDELEPESKQMIRSALKVHHLLHGNAGYRDPLVSEAAFDYSGVIVQLAKMFEKELNLSFVHWMRKNLGILLPQYFNIKQPDASAMYMPDNLNYEFPRGINFNHGYNTNWIPPTMGQSLVSFKSVSREEDFFTRFRHLEAERFNGFLGKWEMLKRIRNDAAHNSCQNVDRYNSFRNLISEISEDGIFRRMYRMKCEFRGARPYNHNFRNEHI